MNMIDLVAQATQAVSEPAEDAAQNRGGMWQMLGYMAILFFIFWFIVFRPRKQEQKQREKLLGQIKKHDKVMTIGGVIGTVMEVRDDEVILKVDDNSNTRMKFIRGSIQKVITPTDKKDDREYKK